MKWRRSLAPFIVVALLADSLVIVYIHLSIPTVILLLMSLYRICNLLRLIKARIHKQYLRRVTIQSSIWIIIIQNAWLMLWQIAIRINISTYRLWLVFLYADLVGTLILLGTTLRQLRKTQVPDSTGDALADNDYPTLTVAIPARNETDELEACLKSLVASNYPKLEIVVIDDCSQDKRTPDIIRYFAQDGVRFIQGKPPEDNWLAKNLAYQRLLEESNGELVLFCGVDVRFQSDSLRQLVLAMLHKQKSMISIIPKNVIFNKLTRRDSIMLQPIRYAWELALPRKLFRRLPVLSTCWIIKRETLETAGNFGAVSRSIVPESYFARASAIHDGYSFMQSNESIGITSHKNFIEQRSTFIRTRYPQLHRRMELVLVVTLIQIISVITPYALIILAVFGRLSLQLTIVSILTILTLTIMYFQIVRLTYRKWIIRAVLLPPVFTILDVALLNYSMFRYEFSSVIWKDRNICIPIMHNAAQLVLPPS